MSHIGTKFLLADKFIFDPTNNSLLDPAQEGDVIRLGSNESRLLLVFSQRPNEVISREQLHEFVWREQGFQVDDSSLTQAISTLRKLLGDSTRAPEFVKTVPKRGYQFIARVDKPEPGTVSAERTEPVQKPAVEAPPVTTNVIEPRIEASATVPDPTGSHLAKSTPLISRVLLMLAIILPISVYMLPGPAKTAFIQVDKVQQVPVMTTADQPPLDKHQPVINRCVQLFLNHQKHPVAPSQVIVTVGVDNSLIFNAIYPVENTAHNATFQVITTDAELSSLCQ